MDQFVITSFALDMAEVCAGPGSCAAPVNGTEDTTCSAAKSRVSSQYDPIIITRRMLSIMGERELRLHSESKLCTALHSE